MAKPTCWDCPYWHHLAGDSGQCRRHAPPAVTRVRPEERRSYGEWPDTFDIDFCGEHPAFALWISGDWWMEKEARRQAASQPQAASDSPTDPPGRPT